MLSLHGVRVEGLIVGRGLRASLHPAQPLYAVCRVPFDVSDHLVVLRPNRPLDARLEFGRPIGPRLRKAVHLIFEPAPRIGAQIVATLFGGHGISHVHNFPMRPDTMQAAPYPTIR